MAAMVIEVRQLDPSDARALFELRRRALLEEPFAFLSSLEDDAAGSVEAVRELLARNLTESVVFGALGGARLVAMTGLARDQALEAAHRACVWGVFVSSDRRRAGIGARLIKAIVEHARGVDSLDVLYLSVSEKTPAARGLYEAAGFTVWGVEPDFIRINGQSGVELHMRQEIAAPRGEGSTHRQITVWATSTLYW
jgi:GNAT superfamily N-acetyltransferase